MNLWRGLGITLFLLGAVCLVGSTKLPVFAGEKDKDKDKTAQKDKDKDKDSKKKTEEKKVDDTKKKTEEKKVDDTKKTEEKKVDDTKKKTEEPKDKKEAKVDPPKASGDKWAFSAFAKGKKFYQEQTTTTKQKLTVNNQTIEQNQTQTFIIEWTGKDEKDGNYIVTQKIVGVDMKIDIGGNNITYNSTAKNPKNPMTDFFEQLTKSELTFTISPSLEVKSVTGRDEFIKGLSDINPQMQGLLKAILSEKALKKMAEPTWWAFPDKAVAKGDTWNKESDLDLGPIGTYKTKFEFTAKGEEKGNEKIGIKTTLAYSPPTEKSGLPFTIHEAKLSGESSDGEALFNRAKGRFERTEINMKLAGQLTIEVGSMKTSVTLDQTQKAVSATFDANPWENKK